MKKSRILLATMVIITGITNAAQAQFRNNIGSNTDSPSDTTYIPAKFGLNPTFQKFTPVQDANTTNNPASYKGIRFSNTAKFFLGIGADLIRGDTEDIPEYSLENAWKYPGPTVRYPETATEYELFLERYQRYTSDH